MSSNEKLAEILLVEDNEGDIELTREAFESAKFQNTLNIVVDGDEALDYLYKRNGQEDAKTPDIILLDLNLPGTDGKEVLTIIKSDPVLKAIPVIILTSSSAEKDIVESYGLHANCYLVKPVSATHFTDMIKHIENFWIAVVCLPDIGDDRNIRKAAS